ncbi:MAG: hypothetical protein M1414_07150 [Candidatus Thermoplasmatota archaeon]|jgi:hypothetical protein|nr:hypothetical protein [Candidatus Thermoplasmatota archaeon]MCL5988658.1 hypothetical protein [Candidatus Thermoplasmatota archaeon]
MVKGVIPSWEDPVFRFLVGRGELLLNNSEGQAFTIWEALLHFKDEEYPLVVRGKEYSKDVMLFNACETWNGDPEVAKPWINGTDDRKKMDQLCKKFRDE